MAGIKIGMGFERTGAFPIDETMALTKAQMLTVNDNAMPDKYLTVCQDDGNIYLYDKNAVPSPETGKFTALDFESYDDSELTQEIVNLEVGLSNTYTKSEVDAKIVEEVGKFDKLDYKKADAIPTATKVTIDGEEVDVEEGTRYIVKDENENRFFEYLVLDGVVYNMGPASSSAVSAVLHNELEVTNPVGKYIQGEKIPANTSMETIIRNILSKTYNPVLTAPKAILDFNVPALAKVGATVNGGLANAVLDRGSINPQYTSESANRSGQATNYGIMLNGADSTYSDSNDNGAFTVPNFTKNSKGSVEIEIFIDYAAGVQPKDSDGGDYGAALEAGTVSASKLVEFILPFYYGASASISISDFTGLTEDLKKSGNKSYSITTNNEHPIIAYDASYGDLISILDQNGFETLGGWIKENLAVEGQLYTVYIHDNATTDTGANYTFKF